MKDDVKFLAIQVILYLPLSRLNHIDWILWEILKKHLTKEEIQSMYKKREKVEENKLLQKLDERRQIIHKLDKSLEKQQDQYKTFLQSQEQSAD